MAREVDGEGVGREVDAPPLKVIADGGGEPRREGELIGLREVPAHAGVADTVGVRGNGAHEGQGARAQVGKDRRHVARLHPALVVAQQRIVGMVVVAEIVGLTPRKVEHALECRQEVLEIGRFARLDPVRVCAGLRARPLGNKASGQFGRAGRIVVGHSGQRNGIIVGIVTGLRARGIDQPARLCRGQ